MTEQTLGRVESFSATATVPKNLGMRFSLQNLYGSSAAALTCQWSWPISLRDLGLLCMWFPVVDQMAKFGCQTYIQGLLILHPVCQDQTLPTDPSPLKVTSYL